MSNHCELKPLFKQLWGAIPLISLHFTNGFVIGLQTVIVPSLRTSTLKLSDDQESWLASISVLMLIPSDGICGPLSDFFGRKPILIIALIPQIITCILLYFAKDYNVFFLAFMIAGFWGAGFTVSPMYVAEMSSPKYRGSLLNTRATSVHVGLAVAHGLGNFLDWKTITLYGILANTIGLVVATSLPESPAWLASKGRFNECKEAFNWFRSNRESKELDQLIQQQNYVLHNKCNVYSSLERVLNYWRHPGFCKAIITSAMCFIFIEMCGKQIFIAYAFDAIRSVVNEQTNVFYYALGFDIADAASLVMSCFVVKKFNRRYLVFGVGSSALILLLLIIVFMFFLSRGYLSVQYSFITLILLSLYFALLNMAVIPNLFAVTNEIYPLSHRAIGAAIAGVMFSLSTFTVTKITPSMLRSYDLIGTFLLSLIISAIALLYLYVYMPETGNKTLQCIEEEMFKCAPWKEDVIEMEATQKMLNSEAIAHVKKP